MINDVKQFALQIETDARSRVERVRLPALHAIAFHNSSRALNDDEAEFWEGRMREFELKCKEKGFALYV